MRVFLLSLGLYVKVAGRHRYSLTILSQAAVAASYFHVQTQRQQQKTHAEPIIDSDANIIILKADLPSVPLNCMQEHYSS